MEGMALAELGGFFVVFFLHMQRHTKDKINSALYILALLLDKQ